MPADTQSSPGPLQVTLPPRGTVALETSEETVPPEPLRLSQLATEATPAELVDDKEPFSAPKFVLITNGWACAASIRQTMKEKNTQSFGLRAM